MKLNWLVIVALGVTLAGCGEVAPEAVADPDVGAPEQIIPEEETFRREVGEAGSVPEAGSVSAMAVRCFEMVTLSGACGCDAGSSCGFPRMTSIRYGTCQTGCVNCAWGPWSTSTVCAASASCTSC